MNHMPTVYTLTFNPSLDLYLNIDDLRFGITNRTFGEYYQLGGKGFNVSRVINNLGFDTCAVGFIGGFIGEEIAERVKCLPFKHHLIHKKEGLSRINIKFNNTEINLRGIFFDRDDFEQLLYFLKDIGPEDLIVISGSFNAEDPKLIKSLLSYLDHRNIRFILDTYPKNFLDLLAYRPFLIKPNIEEINQIFKSEAISRKEIIARSEILIEKGVQNIIVSLGKKGSIAVLDHEVYQSAADGLRCINSVGAGDSMIAGFIAGYLCSGNCQKAYRLAVACANACVTRDDLPDFDSIKTNYRSVKINRLNPDDNI